MHHNQRFEEHDLLHLFNKKRKYSDKKIKDSFIGVWFYLSRFGLYQRDTDVKSSVIVESLKI